MVIFRVKNTDLGAKFVLNYKYMGLKIALSEL